MIDTEHMARHSDDVERLTQIAFVNGILITEEQAYTAWSEVSDDSAAGWLILDDCDARVWWSLSSRLQGRGLSCETPAPAAEGLEDDITRIINIAEDNKISITAPVAYSAWRRVSRIEMNSNWMDLPGYDNDLWDRIQPGLEAALEEA